MKRLLFIVLFQIWFWVTVCFAQSYSTTFPNAESPLSQNGQWIDGKTTGLDWCDVASVVGAAHATCYQGAGFNDSTAVLSGSWPAAQWAQGVVYEPTPVYGNTNEVELRVNTTIKAHQITGYEANCSIFPGNPYANIVRWNGPLGSFSVIRSEQTQGCKAGDVLKFSNDGTGNLTLTKNGTTLLTVTDKTPFTNGSPGMGFDNTTSNAVNTAFGFSSFTAGAQGVQPPPSTSYVVSITWQNPGGNDPPVFYNVYRSTGTVFQKVNTAAIGGLSFTDVSVAGGITYHYYGTSVDANGIESGPSSTATVTVPGGIVGQAPLPPSAFTAVAEPK